jgi:uncharacterized protein YoxC
VQTTDPAVLDTLQRIATAQVVIAVAVSVIALIALGGVLVMAAELRSVHRMVRDMRRSMNAMKPQLGPLVNRMKVATDDIAGMTGDARRRMDDVLHTVEDLHRGVKRAAAATEDRVRRFDAVLDIVQTEAEELMLDAAATAHGLHEAARSLRESPTDRATTGTPARVAPDHEEETE